MIRITEPGVHRGMDAEAYHKDPCVEPSLSSTLARTLLNQSPLHAWTESPRLNPDHEPENKKTYDIGRAAHRQLLGVGGDWVAIPESLLSEDGGVRTKDAKAFVEDARADGKTPIKPAEADMVIAMAARCREKLRAVGLTLDPEQAELPAFAEIDGVWCRAMLDCAPAKRRFFVDFKTTTDASPEAAVRAIAAYGYDTQIQHYREVWAAATGERRDAILIMQEKTPPFEVALVRLCDDPSAPGDWTADAAAKCAEARALWGDCLRSGVWPGYPSQILEVGAPSWHRAKWADRALPVRPERAKPSQAARDAALAMMQP